MSYTITLTVRPAIQREGMDEYSWYASSDIGGMVGNVFSAPKGEDVRSHLLKAIDQAMTVYETEQKNIKDHGIIAEVKWRHGLIDWKTYRKSKQ